MNSQILEQCSPTMVVMPPQNDAEFSRKPLNATTGPEEPGWRPLTSTLILCYSPRWYNLALSYTEIHFVLQSFKCLPSIFKVQKCLFRMRMPEFSHFMRKIKQISFKNPLSFVLLIPNGWI